MNPCYECKDRHTGCHAECEDYIGWQKAHAKEKDAELRNRCRDYELNGYQLERADRVRRATKGGQK